MGLKFNSIKLYPSCQQWVRPDESRHIPDSVRVPRAAAVLPRSVGRTNPAAALSLCLADTIKRMIEMCTIIHTCHRRGNNQVAIVSTCDISNNPQTRRRVTVVAFIVRILDSLYLVSKFYHCSKVNIHFFTNSENFQKLFFFGILSLLSMISSAQSLFACPYILKASFPLNRLWCGLPGTAAPNSICKSAPIWSPTRL